jgi:chromosome transmission fidelity protein 18
MDKSVTAPAAPIRYAVRQVLDQELYKEKILQSSMARQARSSALMSTQDDEDEDKENQVSPVEKVKMQQAAKPTQVKRDFFGRIINEARPVSSAKKAKQAKNDELKSEDRVWVSFHEGFSNAVRKPITLRELLDAF